MRCEKFFISSCSLHPLPSSLCLSHAPAQHPQLDSCEPLSMGKGSASCKTGAGPAIIFSATPNSSTPPSLSLRFFGFLQNEAQRSVWQTDFSQTQIRALKRKGKKKCRNFHKIRITAVILYEGPQRQSRTRRRTPKFMSSTKNMYGDTKKNRDSLQMQKEKEREREGRCEAAVGTRDKKIV